MFFSTLRHSELVESMDEVYRSSILTPYHSFLIATELTCMYRKLTFRFFSEK